MDAMRVYATERLGDVASVDHDEDVTPLECLERCEHSGACVRMFGRCNGMTLDLDTLAAQLGCDDCDEWCENEVPALRRACRRLVEACGVGEAMTGHRLVDARLADTLRGLGFRVGE